MDEERIRKRLALIDETAGLLKKDLPATAGSYATADRKTKDATERRLQVLSEAQLDLVRTLYKDLGNRIVGDEESLLRSMEGTMGKQVTEHVIRRRALRNGLVNANHEVDEAEVFRQARDLDDIRDFQSAVRKLMAAGRNRRGL